MKHYCMIVTLDMYELESLILKPRKYFHSWYFLLYIFIVFFKLTNQEKNPICIYLQFEPFEFSVTFIIYNCYKFNSKTERLKYIPFS